MTQQSTGPLPSPGGSPYDATVGWAGGPWAETPLGQLWDGSGAAGFIEKMDPLQMLAGIQNAGIQSILGPVTDIMHDIYGTTLPSWATDSLTDLTIALQNITGYDLVNLADQSLLTGWTDLANSLDLTSLSVPTSSSTGRLSARSRWSIWSGWVSTSSTSSAPEAAAARTRPRGLALPAGSVGSR